MEIKTPGAAVCSSKVMHVKTLIAFILTKKNK